MYPGPSGLRNSVQSSSFNFFKPFSGAVISSYRRNGVIWKAHTYACLSRQLEDLAKAALSCLWALRNTFQIWAVKQSFSILKESSRQISVTGESASSRCSDFTYILCPTLHSSLIQALALRHQMWYGYSNHQDEAYCEKKSDASRVTISV